MKIKIEIDLTNKRLLFDLASIGMLDLLNYPEILFEKDYRGNNVLSYFCKNINSFEDDKQKTIIDFVLGMEQYVAYENNIKDTPLHFLASRGRLEIMRHPLFNTIKNDFGHTPYYCLIKSVPTIKLKECFIVEELLKTLAERKWLGPVMALDALLDRASKPTIKQIRDLGIPLSCDKNKLKRKISYEDISNFKKNNTLQFIFS
jgi:hypothetical protein